ncbi:MAG: hypothetical protein BRD50_07890 [Bacteroidetes bacterium SW_11_45_7]|nr:MAG: hypothetical protein BRD50_07890 [Bacteroidetes bacterium SW_11_45_7]
MIDQKLRFKVKGKPTFLMLMLFGIVLSGCISNEDRAKTAMVKDIDWINGTWQGTDDMKRNENWKQVSNQAIHGKGFLIDGGDTLSKAVMKISKPQDRVEYIIRMRDTMEPSKLKLTSLGPNKAVFVNKGKGSPQKVSYWYNKTDKILTVKIESKGETQRFEMKKADSS